MPAHIHTRSEWLELIVFFIVFFVPWFHAATYYELRRRYLRARAFVSSGGGLLNANSGLPVTTLPLFPCEVHTAGWFLMQVLLTIATWVVFKDTKYYNWNPVGDASNGIKWDAFVILTIVELFLLKTWKVFYVMSWVDADNMNYESRWRPFWECI